MRDITFGEKLKQYKRDYYFRNKEKMNLQSKENYEENKEKYNKASKERYELKKEEISKQKKEYYNNNKEEHKEWNLNYIKNNEATVREYKHIWYFENKDECIAKAKVSKSNRRMRIYNNGGRFTKKEWLALCDAVDNKCVCCNSDDKLTVDHIIPISKGGTNYISNIQHLCLLCNLKKGIKIINYIDIVLVDN